MRHLITGVEEGSIAGELGIRPVSVRVQLSRARRHLAALLGKEGTV